MKKRYLGLLAMSTVLTLGLVAVNEHNSNVVDAADETVTVKIADYADAHSWSDATKYTSINLNDYVTATVTGGGNTGKYYVNGEQWRLYQTETPTLTIKADEGFTLKTVKITYASDFFNNTITTKIPNKLQATIPIIGALYISNISVILGDNLSSNTTNSLDTNSPS